jgi:hypothetical protein
MLPEGATGTVFFYIDGELKGNATIGADNVAKLEIAGLDAGIRNVNVTYGGNSLYARGSNTSSFNVTSTDKWKLNITTEEAIYGQNATFYITVPDNVLNENITITIDGNKSYNVTLKGGKGNFTLDNFTAGMHYATATYQGDARYSEKSSTAFIHIGKENPLINLTRLDNGDVVAVLTGNGTINGTVSFYVNGEKHTFDVINGNATLPASYLPIGNNTVLASYNPDSNHNHVEIGKNFTVDKITTDLTVNATPKVVLGQNTTIIVNMTNVTEGTVLIEVNGYNYTVEINSSGIAKLEIALPEGKYNATALPRRQGT